MGKEETALATVAPLALAAVSFDSMRQMAESIAKSGLFAEINTADRAMTLMLLCQSEGLHPVAALRRYHIIKGKPSMKADAMLADFQRQGGKVRWLKSDADQARCVFTHALGGEVEFAFTFAEAKHAGLTSNPSWEKFPAAMLRARCVSGGIRMVLPGIVAGIYTPEEVEDFDTAAPRPMVVQMPSRAAGAVDAELLNDPSELFAEEPTRPATPVWVGLVAEVRKKDGQKNGKPYSLFRVVCDGAEFSTFDQSLAEAAKAYAGTGERVVVEFTEDKFGKKITGISAADQPPAE